MSYRNYLFQLTSYKEREKKRMRPLWDFCKGLTRLARESEEQLRVAPSLSHYYIHYWTVFSIIRNNLGHSPRASVIPKGKFADWRTRCSTRQYYRVTKSLWERTTLFPNMNHSNDTSNLYLSLLTHSDKREYVTGKPHTWAPVHWCEACALLRILWALHLSIMSFIIL